MVEVFETGLAELFIVEVRLEVCLADLTVRGRLCTHCLRFCLHVGAEEVVETVTLDQFIERCDRCQVSNRDQEVHDVHLEARSKRDDPADPIRDALCRVLGEYERTVSACTVGH